MWLMIAGSSLAIEGVQWGRQGPFALNIWVKQLTDNGNLFQYVISTRNRTLGNITDASIFDPNQVSCSLIWPVTHKRPCQCTTNLAPLDDYHRYVLLCTCAKSTAIRPFPISSGAHMQP